MGSFLAGLIAAVVAGVAGLIGGVLLILLAEGIKACKRRFLAPKRTCENCIRHHTIDCPNSELCYSRKDKPYWQWKF
jgi:hypothetical protein